MSKDIIANVKELQRRVQQQEVSVLIGSGFSKNVSQMFPSWRELLHDMAKELYGADINDSFKKLQATSTTLSKTDESTFKEKKVNSYIDQVGYLDMVSLYLKRKGHREAITTYIEANIPMLVREKTKTYLIKRSFGDNQKIELKDDMLSLHRLVLQLPWNNIYTTNYDEMLEAANNTTTAKKIMTEISKIRVEIDDCVKKEAKVNQEIKNLKTKRFETQKGPNKELDAGQNFSKDLAQKQNDIKLSYKRGERKQIKNRVDDLESELSNLLKAHSSCLAVVKHSSQLSIKRNRNIIKLHGSLRHPGEQYGFDGDLRKHYVIAKEDYDTYPSKHEAFTQLMRISLLQESYCLIGFSGSDPNFMEWIKWVRDVVERHAIDAKTGSFKIYLIDVSAEEPTPEKKLFFENHRVCRIPLMDIGLVDLLENKVGGKKTETRSGREVLELFLRYLSDGSRFNSSQVTFEIIQHLNYRKIWDSMSIPFNGQVNIKEIAQKSGQVKSLKKYNRLAPLHIGYSIKKNLLRRTEALLLEIQNDDRLTKQILDLIQVAFKDTFLLPGQVWSKDSILNVHSIAKRYPLQWSRLNQICLREAVLDLNKALFNELLKKSSRCKHKDWFIYEKVLFAAFSFDFTSLDALLNDWNPSEHWVLKKAGMLAHFNNDAASDLLSDNNQCPTAELSQEELYRLQLLSYISQNLSITSSKDFREKMRTYKEAGLKNFNENFDWILRGLGKTNEKINQYGHGRYTVSGNGIVFSNDFTDPQKGLQFIQLLIESGLPLSLSRVNWRGHQSWYYVFLKIFEVIPFPTLFYSLQYSDEMFLRRIGQDYSFSDKLESQHEEILLSLLRAYLSSATPYGYKESILCFCSEMFNVVKSELWEDLFGHIWRHSGFQKHVFGEYSSPEEIFASAALPFLKSPELIRCIILDSIRDKNWRLGLELLFHLNKNNHLNEIGSRIQDDEFSNVLNGLILQLQEEERILFKLGNLEKVLTQNQKDIIIDILKTTYFKSSIDRRIWRLLLYFANDDKALINKIRTGIVSSKSLWDAGFTERGLSSGNPFIRLSSLMVSRNHPRGIIWSKKEAEKIYQRLKETLGKIEEWLERRDNHNFMVILQEMELFLVSSENKLRSVEDYESTLSRVGKLYQRDRGFDSLADGLLSPERSTVVWALSDLAYKIEADPDISEHLKSISLLLNKILLQSEPAIEACLEFIAVRIEDKQLEAIFSQSTNLLLLILHKYFDTLPPDSDKPFVHRQLIRIAIQLRRMKECDSIIDRWLERQRTSRFNDVREPNIE